MHHAGAGGAGAAPKLAANALFTIQVAAVAEMSLVLDRRLTFARAIEILGATPILGAAKGAAAQMVAGAFVPLFPVELVERDLGYAASAAGGRVPLVEVARAGFGNAIRAGFGQDNLTAVARLYRDT